MSYEIVKSIKIDKVNKKVFIRSAANNVHPLNFRLWEATLLSKLFEEKGLAELEKAILLEYYKSNLQKSNNNYEKSLILLDYQIYNWDTVGDENSARQNLKYSYDELKEVLYKNYLTFCKREKGNFIIFNKQKELYVSRFVKNGCYLVPKQNAKVFPSKEDAQIALQNFDISKYEIMEVI